jgi:hypothetical protein
MAGKGLNLKIDTTQLLRFAKRAEAAMKVTQPILAAGINLVGDGVISKLAESLTQQTGLTLEQVRGQMKVKRAGRGRLSYEVTINKQLLEDNADTLEGQREIRDFGKRQPGELVIIVSKKDELVCMECEELEAAGPMPIEIATQHVPKHINCRCIILPYNKPGKRLPVTMTTLTGTDPRRRAGKKRVSLDTDVTLLQLAQNMLNNSSRKLKIELKR